MRGLPLLIVSSCLVVGCQSTPESSRKEAPPAATTSEKPAAAPAVTTTPEQRKFVDDMNRFCVITQDVRKDASIRDADKPQAIARRLVSGQPCAEFLVFMQALADVPKDKQYPLLKQAAADRGAPAWSCPALADDG